MRGFAVLEILVTLMIGIILTGISLPTIREINDLEFTRRELREIASNVQEQARRARGENISTMLIPSELEMEKELITNRRTIIFYPNGVATPTTLTLKAQKNICTLSISLRARTRIRCKTL